MATFKRIKKLDENVINKIAAGEIIQGPANAVKELLENSLDAGSSQIIITIKEGGLSVIQLQDNGCGICKDDFPLLCEKFTTSKLQEFHDLLTIATFGFRGEALASITHVARVTITSKTSESSCAFKAEFSNSKLLNPPKPCAGNTGTIVRVEDLFYNISIRKQTLKNVREEYSKIIDVVSSYAILNSYRCSITLKRTDDNANPSPDVRIVSDTSVDDCIVELFGGELSKQLIIVDYKDDKLAYSLSGRISKPNYNTRKLKFILFINQRLVHCSFLKKCLESMYGNLLPKHTFPFIFLHLELPSKNLDVNVHPTKYEVHFLHQELIVASIQDHVEKLISSSSASRSFSTSLLLNKSFKNSSSPNTSFSQLPRPSEKVRVDPKMQKISSFYSKSDLNASSIESWTEKNHNEEVIVKDEFSTVPIKKIKETISFPKIITSKTPEKSTCSTDNFTINQTPTTSKLINELNFSSKPWKDCKIDLPTLEELREAIESTNICDWKNFVYVGIVDRHRILVQREKDLILVNTQIVNYNLFYQLCLHYFGNFGTIDLIDNEVKENHNNRTYLKDLFEFGIRETGELYKGVDATALLNIFKEKSAMLADYFSIKIDMNDMTLLTIPLIIDNFVPDLTKLPKFIVNLCTKVNWSEEKSCLHGVCREIAEFYAYGVGSTTSMAADKLEFESVFEKMIFPMYKSFLRIPLSFEQDGTLVTLTSIPDLYNVFERC